MSPEHPQPLALIRLLGELGRMELDLLVRDQGALEAVRLLTALRQELEQILGEAWRERARIRGLLDAMEARLEAAWPGSGALELLDRLAEERKILAELDLALRPAHSLLAEVVRRSSRRPSP